jgi:hypothetical protein
MDKKIRIRNKHTGSATLFFRLLLKNSLPVHTSAVYLVVHAGGLDPNPDSAKSLDSDQDVVHVFK